MPRKKDEERAEIVLELASALGAKDNCQVVYRDGQLLVRLEVNKEDTFFPAAYFWVWVTRADPGELGKRPVRSGGHGVISRYEEDDLADSVKEIMSKAGKMGPPDA